MHVAAVLECLYDYSGLKFDFRSVHEKDHRNKSLNQYSGKVSGKDFAKMRSSIENWGCEYLLADVISRNFGGYKKKIISYIEELHNKDILSRSSKSHCIVSGVYSNRGRNFVERSNALVFGSQGKKVKNSKEHIKYPDICILVVNSHRKNVGIFEEVEGKKGGQMRKEKYWEGKGGEYNAFGIGFENNGEKDNFYGTVNPPNEMEKLVLLFQGGRNVIRDFHRVTHVFTSLFDKGPGDWISTHIPGLQQPLELIEYAWEKPLPQTLALIRGEMNLISAEEQVELISEGVPDEIITPDAFGPRSSLRI